MPRPEKLHKVMHEFKHGTLRSSSGQKVVNRKQAIAIAMSEAGMQRRALTDAWRKRKKRKKS